MTIIAGLPTEQHRDHDAAGSRAWSALELLEADFDDSAECCAADWVDAAPFRAHLRQLISEHGVAWRTVAVLAEVPPAVLAQLLRGRHGRPATRIHPLVAQRLFQLTGAMIVRAATESMPARNARAVLRLLTADGWPVAELAVRTGVPAAELTRILRRRGTRCSRLTAATIKAAGQALSGVSNPQPPGRVAAVAGTPGAGSDRGGSDRGGAGRAGSDRGGAGRGGAGRGGPARAA
jgi:predicted transcriptional regulator